MSKELITRKEQGRIIAEMNDAINRINDTSYTVIHNLEMAHTM
jgi:hypothetical protein